MRVVLGELGDELLDPLPLQVRLQGAGALGDHREAELRGAGGDVRLGDVGERSNHHVATVVGAEPRRHRLELPGVEEVQEQGLDDVVAVVAEGDLGGTELDRDVVEDAAPEPRAEHAGGVPRPQPLLDDPVDVLADDPVGHALTLEVRLEDVHREPGGAVIEVHGDEGERERRTPRNAAEQSEQDQRVLAAAHADHHVIVRLQQPEVGAGARHLRREPALEAAPTHRGRSAARRTARRSATRSRGFSRRSLGTLARNSAERRVNAPPVMKMTRCSTPGRSAAISR